MKKKSVFGIVLFLGILTLLSSCKNNDEIEIDGSIYYTNGQVKSITVTVSGGKEPYDLYYARSTSEDWNYAKGQRISIGTCKEGKSSTYSATGEVSKNYYYYIWAIDSEGNIGQMRLSIPN